MRRCTNCGTVNEETNQRCYECDEALPHSGKHPVRDLIQSNQIIGKVSRTGGGLAVVLPSGDMLRLSDGDIVSLGRSSASPVSSLCGDNVSRHHATLRMTDRLLVKDEWSTNGTFVNGVLLEAGAEADLHPGDVIELATDPPVTLLVADPARDSC